MLYPDPIEFQGVANVDEATNFRYIYEDEAPPRPEGDAFDQLAVAFAGFLSEDQIDSLPISERNYWAAFVTVIAALAVDTPQGERLVLGTAEIKDLHAIAQEQASPTGVLQDFSAYIVRTRKQAHREALPSNPDHLYASLRLGFNSRQHELGEKHGKYYGRLA